MRATKRQKVINEKIKREHQYPLAEAIRLVKACATAKFNEGVDVAINLGVDVNKSEQAVRGATVLPHGTGRKVKVAVFAPAEEAEKAKQAGADVVGLDDLVESVQKGNIDFDVAIATPDAMRVVSKLGQVLGPRGLMPNPKVGTVTTDVVAAVKSAKQGQVRYRTDKSGIIHCSIGKADFSEQALQENFEILLADIKKAKPSAAKGIYLKKLTISSTMGPGIVIDRSSLGA